MLDEDWKRGDISFYDNCIRIEKERLFFRKEKKVIFYEDVSSLAISNNKWYYLVLGISLALIWFLSGQIEWLYMIPGDFRRFAEGLRLLFLLIGIVFFGIGVIIPDSIRIYERGGRVTEVRMGRKQFDTLESKVNEFK